MPNNSSPKLPNKYKCSGCMTCGDACPKHCISFKLMDDGHFMPSINNEECISCMRCERVCPVIATNRQLSKDSQPFASWTKDETLIKKSSSGGVFAQIAKDFIEQLNGCVAGARINGLEVEHVLIHTVKDIEYLQGSKYLQSVTTGIYVDVLEMLKRGRHVLFSGTSCQVAGLYNYVSPKLWENLYTIDLICHGVPSRNDFKLYIESHKNNKILSIKSFRDKTWKYGYAMTLIDESGNKIQDELNYFYDAFNANKTLRWSCYNCPFKAGLQRQSDITIGDFWGAKGYDEQRVKGLSLCIIHSKKGREMISSPNLHVEETKWEMCLSKNTDYFNSLNFYKYHPLRFLYSKFVKTKDMEKLKHYYGVADNTSLKYFHIRIMDAIISKLDTFFKKRATKKIICKAKQ